LGQQTIRTAVLHQKDDAFTPGDGNLQPLIQYCLTQIAQYLWENHFVDGKTMVSLTVFPKKLKHI
jgi:hypothetical protein